MKRILCWLLTAALLLSAGSALAIENAFFGLDQLQAEEEPIRLLLGVDLESVLPFDENRSQQLSRLLKYVRLDLRVLDGGEEKQEAIRLLVDEDALTVCQVRQGEIGRLQSDLLPGEMLTSPDDDLIGLLFGERQDLPFLWADPDQSAWLTELYGAAEALPEAFAAYASTKNVQATVKGMGIARTKTTVSVPKEMEAGFGETLAGAASGSLRMLIRSLTFSGKQTFTLLRDEAGGLIKVTYSGKCGSGAEPLRTVSFTWTLKRSGTEDKDTLSVTSPAAKGKDRDTLSFTRVETQAEGRHSLQLSWSWSSVRGSGRKTQKAEADLQESEGSLTGTVILSETPEGKDPETVSLRLEPTLRRSDGIDGTVSFLLKYGKRQAAAGSLNLSLLSGEMPAWNSSASPTDLAGASKETLQSLQDRLNGALAGWLVRRLVLLPEEDTLYLSADLPPEVWTAIREEAREALKQEE